MRLPARVEPVKDTIATSGFVTSASPTTGPVPVTPTSYPYGAADRLLEPMDLAKDGYVEEEYFISGTANVYDWAASGDLTVKERVYGNDEIAQTSRALDASIRNLNFTLRTILESARSIGSASSS